LESYQTQPKKQCEKIIEFTKDNEKAFQDLQERSKDVLAQLENLLEKEKEKTGTVTQKYLDQQKNDLFYSKAKTFIANYAVGSCRDPKQSAFMACLEEFHLFVSQDVISSGSKFQFFRDQVMPECRYFPDVVNAEVKCKNADLFVKARSAFATLADDNVLKCVKNHAISNAISALVGQAIQEVLEKIFNLLGGFVYAAIKIVYFLVKMTHQFYRMFTIKEEQSNPPTEDQRKAKSRALGKGVGYFINIVKSVLEMFKGKKRNRRIRRHARK